VFINDIHLLYFSYMVRCHIHYLQGELLCPLLETRYCYECPCNENQIHPNPANRKSTKKHNTYQLLYIYSIPPDDGLQTCPKHVEVDWRNKLRINSASSWFSLHGCIEMHGQQNIKLLWIVNNFIIISSFQLRAQIFSLKMVSVTPKHVREMQ
jgi:hypothetical protein